MDVVDLLGSTLGIGFFAGIRLYATVLAIGLAIRFGLYHPAPSLAHLEVLAHTPILAIAGVACVIEFFADKVPWVDSFWDSFHTIVRPVGAALLAATAVGHIDPALKVVIILLCGTVAFTAHSSKAATRLLANHSPEPFTNIGLSLLGDALVPAGLWIAVHYPLITLGVVSGFIAAFLWLAPKIFRVIRRNVSAVRRHVNALFQRGPERRQADLPQTSTSRAR
jgi:hypothetical protein